MRESTGLMYHLQCDPDGTPLLSVASALAFDIFCQCYNPDTFIHRKPDKGDLADIMKDCLETANVLLQKPATQKPASKKK